ncbi:MAG: hypothetical protein QOG00_2046 [Pyrinomonadaceae bacterium]|jgi:hypothetical protein|nr:hypothetical protein [Pyrinomonadaceae bacterium]MDQ1612115.1 hypothetical protein [Pyrinomonadaceae bacterium]
MHEDDEQAETFNQDQQEMFQNPDTNLGETRPRTPGAQSVPVPPTGMNEEARKETDDSGEETTRRAE